MCGRVTIPGSTVIVTELELRYDHDERPAQINIPPTLPLPLFTDSKPNDLQYFNWSLIPSWSKENNAQFSTSNATIEKLEISGMWKSLIGKRHCVVITSGFYEWNYDDPVKKKGSHPHIIKTRGEKLTLMAGLWDAWKDPLTGIYHPSCTIITLPANGVMSRIHNTKGRMPAFLTKETAKIWVDKDLSYSERKEVLFPVSDDFLYTQEIKDVKDEIEVNNALTIC